MTPGSNYHSFYARRTRDEMHETVVDLRFIAFYNRAESRLISLYRICQIATLLNAFVNFKRDFLQINPT